jgi:1,4-dihydroxy-2-naphthoate octaprenyltransferase
VLSYALVLYLVLVPHFLPPLVLVVFLAGTRAWNVIKLLGQPRPTSPPPGFLLWPRWFSTPLLRHIRLFAGLYMLGLFADLLLSILAPDFWN